MLYQPLCSGSGLLPAHVHAHPGFCGRLKAKIDLGDFKAVAHAGHCSTRLGWSWPS